MPDPMQALPDLLSHPSPQCRAQRPALSFWLQRSPSPQGVNPAQHRILPRRRRAEVQEPSEPTPGEKAPVPDCGRRQLWRGVCGGPGQTKPIGRGKGWWRWLTFANSSDGWPGSLPGAAWVPHRLCADGDQFDRGSAGQSGGDPGDAPKTF